MEKKIAAGTFLVLAIALALGFGQLYLRASEVAKVECEGDQSKSREIAKDYLPNSPTFRFDGIEDSLKLEDTNTFECPDWGEFVLLQLEKDTSQKRKSTLF